MATITTRYKGNMLFETEVGDQTVVCDVTPNMGGKGRAPTPPDLFVVSLGACIAAFVAHYCEQHDIDARDMSVETTYDKVDHPAHLTNLKVDVKIPFGECEDREAAIARVAEHCTVHETLLRLSSVEIDILDKHSVE